MLTKNDIDRIAGVLLVLLVVAFVVSIVTQVDVRFDRPDVREDLQGLIDDEALYATKTAFRLAGSLLLVVTGGALYLVFRSHDPALALFVLLGLLAAGKAGALSSLNSFGLMFLARDFVDATGAEADALASVARALKLIESVAFLTTITMLGVGVLSIGVLILRKQDYVRPPVDGGLDRRQHERCPLPNTGHRFPDGLAALPHPGDRPADTRLARAGLGVVALSPPEAERAPVSPDLCLPRFCCPLEGPP